MTSAAPTNWNRKSLLCCRKASLGWPTPKRAELHLRNQKGSAFNLLRRSRTSSPPQRMKRTPPRPTKSIQSISVLDRRVADWGQPRHHHRLLVRRVERKV